VQACQALHAGLEFALAHPDALAEWHLASNTLVVAAVPDELALGRLCGDAAAAGLRVVGFHEPDLGHSLTAATFEPAAYRLVAGFPLAFSPRGEVRT
jgi:hypothetical protein